MENTANNIDCRKFVSNDYRLETISIALSYLELKMSAGFIPRKPVTANAGGIYGEWSRDESSYA